MATKSNFSKMSDEELEEGLDVIKDYIDICYASQEFDKMKAAMDFQGHVVEEYERRIFSV